MQPLILYLGFIMQPKGAEPGLFPKEADLNTISTFLLSIRVDTYAPLKPFHLTKRSGTRLLLSILEKQTSTLYSFILYSGGAGYTLHGYLSQSLKPLLSISKEQISMLHSCLYYLSRWSRSYTILRIKPIIKDSYTSTTTYQLYHHTKPQKPQKPTEKRAKISTTRLRHEISVPYQSRYYLSQGNRSQCFIHALIIHSKGADHILNG